MKSDEHTWTLGVQTEAGFPSRSQTLLQIIPSHPPQIDRYTVVYRRPVRRRHRRPASAWCAWVAWVAPRGSSDVTGQSGVTGWRRCHDSPARQVRQSSAALCHRRSVPDGPPRHTRKPNQKSPEPPAARGGDALVCFRRWQTRTDIWEVVKRKKEDEFTL